MQEKGCSGVLQYVVDANSIFFLVLSKMHLKNSSLNLLFETQPACVSQFLPTFSSMFLIEMCKKCNRKSNICYFGK